MCGLDLPDPLDGLWSQYDFGCHTPMPQLTQGCLIHVTGRRTDVMGRTDVASNTFCITDTEADVLCGPVEQL